MSRFDFLQGNRLLSSFHSHADEAESLYLEGRYELSAFKCRKTLDLVIQWLSQRYYGGEEQINLKTMVDSLDKQGSFSSQEYSALLTIVNIGNKAVHSDALISKNEANTAVKALNLFLRELNNTYKDYQSSSSQGSLQDIEEYFLRSEVVEPPAPKRSKSKKQVAKDPLDIDETNPQKLLALGQRFYRGDGVVRDMKQVVKYWTMAAELHSAEAQFALGTFYEDAYGGRQSYPQAGAWYRRAAQQGHVGAQYKLGLFYENGWGMKQSYKEAREWYAKAAGKKHGEALYRLGLIYENGYKIKADEEKALKYYQRAAALGQQEAQAAVARLLPVEQLSQKRQQPSSPAKQAPVAATRQELAQGEELYTRAQQYFYGDGLQEDQQQAFALYLQGAKLDYGPAQEAVALCYYHGWGMKNKKYKEAVKWYTLAAEQGQVEAQYQLAECLSYGHGCKRNLEQACAWYTRAAEQQHGRAQFKLGLCYEEGRGVAADFAKAVHWYQQAGQQVGEYACTGLEEYQEKMSYLNLYLQVKQSSATGEVAMTSIYQLGRCYQDGTGTDKNLAEAAALYQLAASGGFAEAQYQLAILYELGRGVEHDLVQAVHWYQQAANNGHEEAGWKLRNWFKAGGNGLEGSFFNSLQD